MQMQRQLASANQQLSTKETQSAALAKELSEAKEANSAATVSSLFCFLQNHGLFVFVLHICFPLCLGVY